MGSDEQKRNPDMRAVFAIGLGVGSAIGVSRVVEKALTPHLGDWGAFGIGVVAAAVAAAVVGLVVYALTRKK